MAEYIHEFFEDHIKDFNGTTRSLINKICKCQATFFGHVMRREKLKHLVTTGMIEGKQQGKTE